MHVKLLRVQKAVHTEIRDGVPYLTKNKVFEPISAI